ncbi:hypothetical protein BGZ46_005148, partial [Entomortierella lignicola]
MSFLDLHSMARVVQVSRIFRDTLSRVNSSLTGDLSSMLPDYATQPDINALCRLALPILRAYRAVDVSYTMITVDTVIYLAHSGIRSIIMDRCYNVDKKILLSKLRTFGEVNPNTAVSLYAADIRLHAWIVNRPDISPHTENVHIYVPTPAAPCYDLIANRLYIQA